MEITFWSYQLKGWDLDFIQKISYLLTEGVLRHVKNGKDRDKLINSIYVDGIDSGYDIEKDELTEDWKAYLRKVDL